ncbi:MAG TPA: methionyl-tRNA formyltransferase [Candidatus Saccharimonadales bacterium]|nr:methionyl-tRNA formyltransferase [Candidatus Saccharimonadales bacterium]
MNKIKIAFFGTSDRSLPILEKLKLNFDLDLCVTKSDSKFGRKQLLKETEVKKWAKQNSIKFFEIDKLSKDVAHELANALGTYQIDVGVVADFSFIIPEEVINAPKFKLINIHFSLLPKYRGASPVQFALLNGETKTGITYYLMDKNMDTGEILSQIEYKIPQNITAGALYKEMFVEAAEKLPEVINGYVKSEITPLSQDNSKATYTNSKTHPKNTFIYKEDAKIDFKQTPVQIERQIRAFNPWPIAWTTLGELNLKLKNDKNGDLKVKIFEAEIENDELNIKRLQVEGGKVLDWQQFKNGFIQ